MSETKQILELIINEFSVEKFDLFFRRKMRGNFREISQSHQQYNDSDFGNGFKLGEAEFQDGKLLICSFEVKKSLSERSGKKAQYEKAKSILKSVENQVYSAGIFVFYDKSGSFRFSLVYPESIGTRRQWNHFKRFTYFVSSKQTNKTFLQRIGDGDFFTLVKIKEAFSVEKVTKEFYQDIANWYFWAVSHCQFPKDAEAEENGRNIAVIRMITRMIFIWFMRELGLINKDLFEKQQIQDILKNLNNDESSYYTAILQNLFFATLSTKKEERDFRSEIRGHKGINPDRGNDNVYRYQKLFKNPEKLKGYFGSIPFLNGGLFECLDDRKNNYYVDGFTESKKDNRPQVPNLLFFSAEKKVDLNKAYGTKNKTYKVRGLLDILSSFNFTIDENSPDDADIALDPELLGRVFENLLASFNPETSTTARKATGSYYTPREIVDYMVSESLKVYFKTHLSDIEKIDEKLEQLFSNESSENPFDEKQSKKLVELIECVKIVDPAVGSGAFPMGALNKLVFILNKVDPENEHWKESQIKATEAIPDTNVRNKIKLEIENYFGTKQPDYWRKLYLIQNCIYGVDIQQIAVEITKLRFFISLLVDEDKDDIQPLPNLDFKIMQGNSLLEEYEGIKLFDEKLLEDQEPLQKQIEEIKNKQLKLQSEYLSLHTKNQLTKTRQAELNNELKNLTKQLTKLNQPKKEEENAGLFDEQDEAKQKREALKKLHKEFFETSDKKEKDDIRGQIHKIEWDLIEATLKKENKLSKLKDLEKFKKSKNRPFFLWKLYFAEVFEKGGFDIVIANPPYLSSKNIDEDLKPIYKKSFYSPMAHYDIYIIFIERALQLLKQDGYLCFITSNKYFSQKYGFKIREILLKKQILRIVNFNFKIFEATVDTAITIVRNNESKSGHEVKVLDLHEADLKNKDQTSLESILFDKSLYQIIEQKFFSDLPDSNFRLDVRKEDFDLRNKIHGRTLHLEEICFVIYGAVLHNADKKVKKEKFIFPERDGELKPYVEGKFISRWRINKLNYLKYTPVVHREPRYPELFENPKLIGKRIIGREGLSFIYDQNKLYADNTVYLAVPYHHLPINKYSQLKSVISQNRIELSKEYSLLFLLSVINSHLFKWLFQKYFSFGLDIYPAHIKKLPIRITEKSQQKPFIDLVDKILDITKSADYLENSDKQAKVKEYEKQIDELVYKLYELTSEEIAIVKNSSKN